MVCVLEEKFIMPPAIVRALPESENEPAAPSNVIMLTLVRLLLVLLVCVEPVNVRLLPLEGAVVQLELLDQLALAVPRQIEAPVMVLIQISLEAIRVEYAGAGPDSATHPEVSS